VEEELEATLQRADAALYEAKRTGGNRVVACAAALLDGDKRLVPIGHEKVRGIDAEISIFEYRLAGEACSGTA
jgi:hypothetical protein